MLAGEAALDVGVEQVELEGEHVAGLERVERAPGPGTSSSARAAWIVP